MVNPFQNFTMVAPTMVNPFQKFTMVAPTMVSQKVGKLPVASPSPNDRFSAFDSFVIDSPLQNFVHYKKI